MSIIQLPTEKSEPKNDIRDFTTLLYGMPKIGKSTFCANADGALFLATEAGLNNLSVYQIPIATWPEFLQACQLIAAGEHQYRTIIIDTIDNLWKMCVAHILTKNNLQHESDLNYGKGYDLIKKPFTTALTALSLLPYGLIMISHAQEKDVKTKTGTQHLIQPTIPNSARGIIMPMVDIILYAELEEQHDNDGVITGYDRVIRTKPTTIYEAGDRTGRLPGTLPLDYTAFVAAFNKRENENTEPMKTELPDQPNNDNHDPFAESSTPKESKSKAGKLTM